MPDNRIKVFTKLYQDFCELTNYQDKLTFYDQYFGIIPFDFPAFKPELDILLKANEINTLVEIFEQERKKTVELTKIIECESKSFVFNLRPANSERQLLNDYIIEHFLTNDPGFESAILDISKISDSNKYLLDKALNGANSRVQLINSNLVKNKELSFRNQFLHAFQNGFNDYQLNFIKCFSAKRKIIELYLYAQGILFAKYIEALRNKRFTDLPVESDDLKSRLALFKKYGVLDHLRNQVHSKKKLAQLVSEMIGEKITTIEKLINH